MDAENFQKGMQIIATLPTQVQGEQSVASRYEVYALLFSQDDGPAFLEACVYGTQHLWQWFPTPKEIRDVMRPPRQIYPVLEEITRPRMTMPPNARELVEQGRQQAIADRKRLEAERAKLNERKVG